MKKRKIRVTACAPKLVLANPMENVKHIEALAAQAAESELLVLPGLCLTGASCGDLFRQQALLDAAMEALLALRDSSKAFPKLMMAVTLPVRYGRQLCHAAVFLRDGSLLGAAPLDGGDPRLFVLPELVNGELTFGDTKLPFTRDTKVFCGEFSVGVGPDADICVVPGLFPADADSDIRLPAEAAQQSRETGAAVVLACPGPGESSTDNAYTGLCAVVQNGKVLAVGEEEGLLVSAELNDDEAAADEVPVAESVSLTCPTPFLPDRAEHRCDRIFMLQAAGLVRRMRACGAKKAVIGVSGGLDSTLAVLVAARAMDELGLPRENLMAVTMPCFGTTGRTRSNAELMSLYLGCTFRTVDIGPAVMSHFADIGHDPSAHNVVFENAQARERTQVLMDLANGVGGLLVGTGDMSELALGWCTYGGDQMSMYGVNAGVPKTVVRAVVLRYAETCGDENLAAVLRDVVDTPVSPELLPADEGGDIAQKTEELIGPYALHDYFLYHFLKDAILPEEIISCAEKAFEGEYSPKEIRERLELFLRRFFNMQFKRSCMPDGPAVLGVSLSPRTGWCAPSDANSGAWLTRLP